MLFIGFCVECFQGELQDECIIYSYGGVIDILRVIVRVYFIVGCVDLGYESGCLFSKLESCESVVIVEMDLVQILFCESSIF